MTLVSDGFLEIPIDSTTVNFSSYPLYFANDTCEYYISANELLNSIDVFDLRKKQLAKRTIFPPDGPDGIHSVRRMFIQSLDSIYIFSDTDRKILLIDFNGKILARFDAAQAWMTHLLAPFRVMDGSAYFPYMTFGDNRQQVGHRVLVKQDLASGDYQEFGADYPKVYEGPLFYNFIPYYSYGHKNNFVIRFGGLSTLYNYDIASDSTTVFQMKSKNQERAIQPNFVATEFKQLDDDFEELEQDSYLGVFYDPYNHVYYSVFQKGISKFDVNGDKNQPMIDKPLSVIIFNESFEYVGEIDLKNHTYQNNFVPTKRGLLIATSNPKNPDNNESVLRFEVFKLAEGN
jgi:hypothetical protein